MRFGVVITITCLVLAIAAIIYLNQPVPETSLQPSDQRVPETSSEKVTPPQTSTSTVPTTDTTTENVAGIEAEPDTGHWWDDTGDDLHEHAHTEDPWGELLSENSRNENVAEGEIRDPMSLEALIEKFGDIPEVHTFAAGWEKSKHGIQRPTEEMIEYIEAMNYLFPSPTTERTLEMIKAANAGDLATVRRYVDIQPADPEVERLSTAIKPYFEGKDRVEGLRQLRASDPSLAAKLVRQLRYEATVDSDVSLEEVERFIRLSYESPPETQ